MRRLPILILLILLCLASCKTEKIVTEVVEVPRISVVEKHDTVRDSVRQLDSVVVYQRGDTVFQTRYIDKYHDKVLIKNHNTTDTITRVIKEPFKIFVEVEKELSVRQKIQMTFGKIFLWVLGVASIGCLGYLLFKIKFK